MGDGDPIVGSPVGLEINSEDYDDRTYIRDLRQTSTGPGFEGLTWKAEVLNLTG